MGEDVAVFSFGEETTNVQGGHVYFEPTSSSPDAFVMVEHDYASFPSSVTLPAWQWASELNSSLPQPGGEKWSYDFSFEGVSDQ